jgi:isoleucyl-tRNA synthetase
METNGADIIRLWALSVDFTEDHRIGDEILKGVADQYRKLRNTFRYLLGALDGFSEEERVAEVADMPELERYVLHLLADMDAKLKTAVNDFDFNTYVRLLSDFANNDLSAFFFDIRKDCLYCDAPESLKRRSYRTVLDILFHAMVRYAAPVLVFTAEEVWASRYPDADSVHLLEWPEVDAGWTETELNDNWSIIRTARENVNVAIEPLRRNKELGSSLQANVRLASPDKDVVSLLTSLDLDEIFISSEVRLDFGQSGGDTFQIVVEPTTHHKCGRCWRHLPEVEEDGALCGRCDEVLNG